LYFLLLSAKTDKTTLQIYQNFALVLHLYQFIDISVKENKGFSLFSFMALFLHIHIKDRKYLEFGMRREGEC